MVSHADYLWTTVLLSIQVVFLYHWNLGFVPSWFPTKCFPYSGILPGFLFTLRRGKVQIYATRLTASFANIYIRCFPHTLYYQFYQFQGLHVHLVLFYYAEFITYSFCITAAEFEYIKLFHYLLLLHSSTANSFNVLLSAFVHSHANRRLSIQYLLGLKLFFPGLKYNFQTTSIINLLCMCPTMMKSLFFLFELLKEHLTFSLHLAQYICFATGEILNHSYTPACSWK